MKNLALIAALLVACAVIYVATSPVSGATSTHNVHKNVTHEKTSHAAPRSTAAQGPGPGQTPDYRAIAREDAAQAGISPDIFERQIAEESGFNPRAVSRAGAIGIAQFEPSTAQGLGINPYKTKIGVDLQGKSTPIFAFSANIKRSVIARLSLGATQQKRAQMTVGRFFESRTSDGIGPHDRPRYRHCVRLWYDCSKKTRGSDRI